MASYLPSTQDFIVGEVEHVHDELWHGVPADPEEQRLAILDEEETVAFEPFRCRRKRLRHDHAVFADRTALGGEQTRLVRILRTVCVLQTSGGML